MLSSSVRRVVVSVASQSTIITSLNSCCSRAATAYSFSHKPICHQRRHSSSKPSSPDNGPKDLSSRPTVPASGNTKSSEKSEKSGRRGRKPKEASQTRQLPSVPSTQNIKDEGLALSTFFALYRPISVTQLLPRAISEDSFAQIFTPPTRNRKIADALTTLTQQVQDLELQMNHDKQQGADSGSVAGEGTPMVNVRHPDGSETSVYIQLDAMSGQFMPYAPPPLPRPLSESDADADTVPREEDLTDGVMDDAPPTRVYKATVTIEETVDADGQYKVFAHSPQLVEEGIEAPSPPRTFLERLAERQLRLDDLHRQRFGDEAMQALSVRRQKKRKIKKKKYKKLMRRTRNERRKLDKL